jgi:hypothetical protein
MADRFWLIWIPNILQPRSGVLLSVEWVGPCKKFDHLTHDTNLILQGLSQQSWCKYINTGAWPLRFNQWFPSVVTAQLACSPRLVGSAPWTTPEWDSCCYWSDAVTSSITTPFWACCKEVSTAISVDITCGNSLDVEVCIFLTCQSLSMNSFLT